MSSSSTPNTSSSLSFRITLDHIKEDLSNLESLDSTEYFQDLILNFNRTKENKEGIQQQQQQHQHQYDVFDYILKNVNLNDISDDYIYIREIDNELSLKDIASHVNEHSDNENIDTQPKDHSGVSHSGNKDKKEDIDNSNSQNNNENIIEKAKSEIKRNKKKMIKKVIELKSHDTTFNEAFKLLETDRWLKSKGLDLISEDGTIQSDIMTYISELNTSIDQIQNIIDNNNNSKTKNSIEKEHTSILTPPLESTTLNKSQEFDNK
ncbi:hypothetical protein DLAC_07983 [Tieghemostelium lacteum]|uniref:Uncharacterized protein n=1 Tax=Tieghemostelium lacteum TaxID=361077 RepID=A0A151ZAV8_TIELA|nr:hypothetical protein DLAC_07983 [Tieghemostelium lacteum]|eukprot:KYQ91079.1 hypothetical protein DLAC_07983 [Tieghemostelium lacteum]